jgi:uncharacterized protein YihD (DUF1040 family)
MSKTIIFITLFGLISCGGFQAKRVDNNESDEKALEITDQWLQRDTEVSVKSIMEKLSKHKGFNKYLKRLSKEPKMFVADMQNKTDASDFPIDDFNDELLTKISETGDFILIDNAAREKILEEVTYQHDGMVDPKEVKTIGRQSGADLLIFGNIHMKTKKRDGKSIKQYSVNVRVSELERGIEVFRGRYKTNKYSKKSSFGF